MNKDEMYNAINKGIPNQVKLELPVKDLINYCGAKEELSKNILDIRNIYENAIVSICGFNKSNHEFFDSLRLITNYKNSDTGIYISPNGFLKRLKDILGVDSESLDLDDPSLIDSFKKRLNVLINSEHIDDLKDRFPDIFSDYIYSINLYDEIRKIEKTSGINANDMRADYQKYGLDTRFRVFLSNQIIMYQSLVIHAKEIVEFVNSNPLSLDNFKGLDKDKFELYVAKRYLDYAKDTPDIKDKQAAIYYLTTYLNEYCGRIISMKYKDKELSNLSLLKDFRKLLKNNHELKPINESRNVFNTYHIKHVKNHINKYFNGLDSWCVVRISPNELLQNQQARIEKIAMNKEEDLRESITEKYLSMLIRKLNFYENSNYELRLFGTGSFESRVAYFYDNGMVVVDKLYDESLDINPTYNEAIYVMDTKTFLNMVDMDKPVLRENDNVKRIIHSGDWEKRLQQELNVPSINVSKEETKVLVNKYTSKKKQIKGI